MASNALYDITAAPAANQKISHDGKEYTTVKEGLAYILIPASASTTPQTTPRGENQPQSVFYNPIQQFNRDLSVLAIKAYGDEVIERKKKACERDKQRNLARKKQKKRKREDNDLDTDASRKAGKVDTGDADLEADIEVIVENEANEANQINEAHETANPQSVIRGLDTVMGNGEAQNDIQKVESAKHANLSKPFVPSFTILDALSATGLRALRYAQEIPFTTSITANDLLPAATNTIRMNVQHNNLEDKIRAVTGNALAHMYSLIGEDCKDAKGRPSPSKKYDVIDLDPYGTAAPFLDAAVQSVRDDGGLLCVTCTDAGVWASNGYPEKAYSLYGGIPIKGMHSHEGGLRLILHAIATSAARYGLAIEPLLSLSIDFYARVFVRIYKSAADVKFLAGKTMIVYNCDVGCGAWTTQMIGKNKLAPDKSGKGHFWKHVFSMAPTTGENCVHCGAKTHMAGPMYAGPIHSTSFIQRILTSLPSASKQTYQTSSRIEGMLTGALEEIFSPPANSDSPTCPTKTNKYDPAALDEFPFFFMPSAVAKVIHCITPHENALRGALRHSGYRVTRSHTKPGSFKTDAPWDVIWEIMREWARQKAPVKEAAIRENTAGYRILGLDKKKVATEIKTSGGDDDDTKNNDKAKEEEETNSSDSHRGKREEISEGKKKLEVVFDEKLGRETDKKKLVLIMGVEFRTLKSRVLVRDKYLDTESLEDLLSRGIDHMKIGFKSCELGLSEHKSQVALRSASWEGG
ncbi:hypothetical protein B7494_g6318 [Chlorociboria aeruginascens]|nr:hypothetical protein B7494_g6318 [Chlorociboria aeruginascens]